LEKGKMIRDSRGGAGSIVGCTARKAQKEGAGVKISSQPRLKLKNLEDCKEKRFEKRGGKEKICLLNTPLTPTREIYGRGPKAKKKDHKPCKPKSK